jgi:SprT-like family
MLPVIKPARTPIPFAFCSYEAVNRLFFDKVLHPVNLSWVPLPSDRMAETNFSGNVIEIRIDPNKNTDEIELLDTIGHESCHVLVYQVNPFAEDHGPEFWTCMSRYTAR